MSWVGWTVLVLFAIWSIGLHTFRVRAIRGEEMFDTKYQERKEARKELESYRAAVMSNPMPNASEMRKLRKKTEEFHKEFGDDTSYEVMRSWTN